MNKGLKGFNYAELYWLGSGEAGGRISTIDLQIGCPWQCLPCGANALTKSGDMNAKDYMKLSDSILEIKVKRKIDILSNEDIYTYGSSDPAYYHSYYNDKEFTIYEIVQDLSNRHNKNVELTTTGWKPGDNYMQRAMENIANNYSPKIRVGYSIKTVPLEIRAEYDKFLEQHPLAYHYNDTSLNLKFIRNSKYIAKIVENLKTLAPLNETEIIGYEFQYYKDEDIRMLNPEYAKYSKLFSKSFMEQLSHHFEDAWYIDAPTDINNKPYQLPKFSWRDFSGVGRALDVGKIKMSTELEKNIKAINSKSKEHLDDNNYFVHINCKGNMHIYYGRKISLCSIPVSKEHFITLANQEHDKSKKKEYLMLSELQGKSLLN